MTEHEAIRILDPETTKEALFGTSREEGIKLVEEACRVAVKALKKQDAKEPVNHDNCGNPTLYTTRCPECFEIVEKSYLGNVSWCRHCGQKINWKGDGDMERLINEEGLLICSKESVCRDDECYCDTAIKAFKKLKQYESLEEQGLLLRLPVAEGSTVYKLDHVYECEFDYDDCPIIPSHICEEYEEDAKCEHEHKKYRVEETKFQRQMIAVLGKTVFVTKEEAEAALKEMEK